MLMYEIWSLGHKPFDNLTNPQVWITSEYASNLNVVNIRIISFQTVEIIRNGVRLSPPPGCPRAIYKLMIQCW